MVNCRSFRGRLAAYGQTLMMVGVIAGCGGDREAGEAIEKPSGHELAGEVEEVTGRVTAEWKSAAGEGMRALAAGGEVFADDTIVTAGDASVTIRLHHNNVRWSLGGGKRIALVASASWTAPRAGGASVLAGGRTGDDTAVAGRHAEREAADTAATALKKSEESRSDDGESPGDEPGAGPPPAETAPPAPPPAPPPPAKPIPRSRSAKASSGPSPKEIQGGGPDESDPGGGVAMMPLKLGQSVSVAASLDRSAVQRVIQRHSAEIRSCYQQALKEKPGLTGKVTVKFVIAPSGAVTSATIASSTVGYEPMEKCIVGRIKGWNFPSWEGEPSTVSYPFNFQSN